MKKRAVEDDPIFIDSEFFDELYSLVNLTGWPYKVNREVCQLRDRALMCLLVLTGLRITEALPLRKLQFKVYRKRIVLKNVKTKKHGKTRSKIVLPKTGSLAKFTLIFENWFELVPDKDSYVFPRASHLAETGFLWNRRLSRQRAFWIVKTTNGKFPHWFRAACENIYGRLVFKSDAWKLKQFMGLKCLDSTTPYVQGTWEEDEHRIFRL